jgi:hypothetical protein
VIPASPNVTLTGDRSGDYVVVEERSDGSLVIAPDASTQGEVAAAQPMAVVGTLDALLVDASDRSRSSASELLREWGVEPREHEVVIEFLVADVDGMTGFIAITTRRFIFVANMGIGLEVVREHLLAAARNVEVVGRGTRRKLRVTWHGRESRIRVPDRESLSCLRQHLEVSR